MIMAVVVNLDYGCQIRLYWAQVTIKLCYIKLRLDLCVTYTIIQSITSSEMCSLHLTHPSAHTPGAVGSRGGVRCLAQGSHVSRGQFLPEPRFEPTTSGYKSNALSIRATTAPKLTNSPRLGIKPRFSAWQAEILSTILMRSCAKSSRSLTGNRTQAAEVRALNPNH